ncbi:MAG: DNA internalization-related competence protein ComEC/Rec2, partial [Gammaproteobacteria bacterium]|nr:DNA internalization-related competence protein ComEC/Rec2 [Gammaproteobacteria bacterium]
AHHGSQTSSTYPFLKKAEPRYVVYSAGYRNSFSHPHINVQSRFQEFGSEASNTANSGMISFSVSEFGDITSISSYRDEKPRYWH